MSISGFLVKSFTNKNCNGCRTSNNIDMKPEPPFKLKKKNMMMFKLGNDDIKLHFAHLTCVTFENLCVIGHCI